MNEWLNEISEVLGKEFMQELKHNPFFTFFKNNEQYIYNPQVAYAVLYFNTGINMLDQEPNDTSRERHILSGDYLFSQFYRILATYSEFKVLNDISRLSSFLISEKSNIFMNQKSLSKDELKYIMFAPLIYLIENGYAHNELNSIIEEYINDLDYESMPYFIRN